MGNQVKDKNHNKNGNDNGNEKWKMRNKKQE